MAYFPPSGSVLAYQTTPSSLLTGASIIGRPPVAVTNTPSISGTVDIGVSPGSVIAFQGGAWTPSISGTVGASIIGSPPVRVSDGSEILDVYEENQVDASVTGVAIMWKSNADTSILSAVTQATPLPVSVRGTVSINPASVSGTVGVSVIGMFPTGTQVIGSIAALQGTNPWVVNFANSSILAEQTGTRVTSIVGSIPSSLLTGIYGHRNDAVASFLGGNLSWNPIATDSAGRTLTKPFAPDENVWTYQGSVVSGSVTLVRASAIGLRQYLTDFWLVNSGSVATLITWQDGSTSILGYAIAPAGTGANSPGINVPLKTARSQNLTFSQTPFASILYLTATGYQAP